MSSFKVPDISNKAVGGFTGLAAIGQGLGSIGNAVSDMAHTEADLRIQEANRDMVSASQLRAPPIGV